MTALVDAHAFIIILKLKMYLNIRYGMDGPELESVKKVRYFCIFKNVQTCSRVHPTGFLMGIGVFSAGQAARVVKSNTHLRLTQRLKMSGVIPPFLLYPFMAWTVTALHFLFSSPTTYKVHINFYKSRQSGTLRLISISLQHTQSALE